MRKFLIFFSALLIIFDFVYATSGSDSIYSYFANASTNELNFTKLTNTLLGILTWFGYAIALCIILVTGIQFMTANSQKKAQLKEKLWLIILGVIVVGGGIPIFKLIFGFVSNIKTILSN